LALTRFGFGAGCASMWSDAPQFQNDCALAVSGTAKRATAAIMAIRWAHLRAAAVLDADVFDAAG